MTVSKINNLQREATQYYYIIADLAAIPQLFKYTLGEIFWILQMSMFLLTTNSNMSQKLCHLL